MLWLLGCAPAERALPDEGYLWQRIWTDEVRQGVREARPVLSALRVLALEAGPERAGRGDWHEVAVDLEALREGDWTVVAVLRWDGRLALPEVDRLAEALTATARRWQDAGVAVRGVELDHDQGTAGLQQYAALVEALNRALPEDLALSITALPTWSTSDALPALLAAADETVLQVHAVDRPERGLFDEERAMAAVRAYARHGAPLAVSLPTYGARNNGQELAAEPAAVARTRARLQGGPREVGRVLWFRVPVRSDHRNWGLPTLSAVLQGDDTAPALRPALIPREEGLYDLVLHNEGAIDAVSLQDLAVTGDCAFADALEGWTAERTARGWGWRGGPGWLKAGERRLAGWVRCEGAPEVD